MLKNYFINRKINKLKKQQEKEYKLKIEDKKREKIINRLKDEKVIKDLSKSFAKQRKVKIKRSLLSRIFPKKILVVMLTNTGDSEILLLSVSVDKFSYNKGEYIIDESKGRYNPKNKMLMFIYHESVNIPIEIKCDLNKIKNTDGEDGYDDIELMINPKTLGTYINSQFIQKMMKGADLDNVFNFLKLLSIIILIVSVVSLLLLIKDSGVI